MPIAGSDPPPEQSLLWDTRIVGQPGAARSHVLVLGSFRDPPRAPPAMGIAAAGVAVVPGARSATWSSRALPQRSPPTAPLLSITNAAAARAVTMLMDRACLNSTVTTFNRAPCRAGVAGVALQPELNFLVS